jgi:hypothetical protein
MLERLTRADRDRATDAVVVDEARVKTYTEFSITVSPGSSSSV